MFSRFWEQTPALLNNRKKHLISQPEQVNSCPGLLLAMAASIYCFRTTLGLDAVTEDQEL
jgi:hypothetical protein